MIADPCPCFTARNSRRSDIRVYTLRELHKADFQQFRWSVTFRRRVKSFFLIYIVALMCPDFLRYFTDFCVAKPCWFSVGPALDSLTDRAG